MRKLKCSGSGTFECNLYLYDKLCMHQDEHIKQENCKCVAPPRSPCGNYKCISIVDIRKEKLKQIEQSNEEVEV